MRFTYGHEVMNETRGRGREVGIARLEVAAGATLKMRFPRKGNRMRRQIKMCSRKHQYFGVEKEGLAKEIRRGWSVSWKGSGGGGVGEATFSKGVTGNSPDPAEALCERR